MFIIFDKVYAQKIIVFLSYFMIYFQGFEIQNPENKILEFNKLNSTIIGFTFRCSIGINRFAFTKTG